MAPFHPSSLNWKGAYSQPLHFFSRIMVHHHIALSSIHPSRRCTMFIFLFMITSALRSQFNSNELKISFVLLFFAQNQIKIYDVRSDFGGFITRNVFWELQGSWGCFPLMFFDKIFNIFYLHREWFVLLCLCCDFYL